MSAINKVKSLNEQVGAKSKEIRTYLDTAAAEKRTIAEDDPKLKELEASYAGLAAARDAEIRQAARESAQPITLSKSEARDVGRFDYAKLVGHLYRAARGQPSVIDGVEAEMIREGETEARAAGVSTSGIVLPRLMVRRNGYEARDMTAGTAGEGGNTIQTDKRGLLDDFFNASVMRAAGATVLEGLQGNLDLPRIVAGTAASGKAENAAADEVSPTTAMLSLTPKRLPAYIDISEKLLMQSGLVTEAVLRSHLTTQMLAVQEAAFFHGGGTNEANGIAGTAGIGSVAGGTNGLAPTFAHMVNLETAVDTTNALLGNLHYASNGQIRGKLKQTQKVSGTDSRMILDADGLINGYQPLFSNAISRTLTKGSSSGVCSAIFFGNFSDYYVGYWSGVSLEIVRDKTNALSGLYTLVASSYYDGGVVRAKSFAAMLDALGA